ncbi:MAG: thiamine pyrophosphate-dependent enzyme, partial [Chloroflexota bacterium]|nr:thiamine pyrophosphate-dependent enzyme [Chloroflexota bacterium]
GIVKEAFHIARTGRPGPVLIDIPMDVQSQTAEFAYPDEVTLPGYKLAPTGDAGQRKNAAMLISRAESPIIIAGRGVIISRAYDELKQLAENSQIPVVNTLMGIGSFPGNHALNFGLLGMHGTAYANMAVQNADLIIAVGTRFSNRVTGNTSKFAPGTRIIHIDIDPAEIGKNIAVDMPIVGDVKEVLCAINREIKPRENPQWLSLLNRFKNDHPSLEIRENGKLLPQYVISQIYQATQGEGIVVTGVGQHQMWAAQHFLYTKPNRFISSGGLGTMGFELPAAIGARVGCPQEVVWCIAGDGSFQMTIEELATMAQDDIAVKIALINNGYLGMVRQWQELFFGRRYVATKLWNPDFMKLAEAYGIPGLRVSCRGDVAPAIRQAMQNPGSFLIEFLVEQEENVYPMLIPGESLDRFLETPKTEMLVS